VRACGNPGGNGRESPSGDAGAGDCGDADGPCDDDDDGADHGAPRGAVAREAERLGRLYPKLYGQAETIRAAAEALRHLPASEIPRIEAGLRRYAEFYRNCPPAWRPRTMNGGRWFTEGHWRDDPETWAAFGADAFPSGIGPPPVPPVTPGEAEEGMRP